MNINDYLIDHVGKDWRALLSGWAEVLPSSFTVRLVNRFGDVFAELDDGSIHLLDIEAGTFRRIAENREHFADEIEAGENANNWLLIPLVDRCVAAGLVLRADQCYGYKMPPMLGGEYVVGNVATVDLAEHYSFLADVWRQTKDWPDGTQVKIVIKH
jgi:hypothetical protein